MREEPNMAGVSLNPASGATGANTLQSASNEAQLTGLDALKESPTFTFAGANNLKDVETPDTLPDWIPNPSLDINNSNPKGGIVTITGGVGLNYLTKESVGLRFVSKDGKIDVTVLKQNKDGTFLIKDNKTGNISNFTSATPYRGK
jgi:hypothetical protein